MSLSLVLEHGSLSKGVQKVRVERWVVSRGVGKRLVASDDAAAKAKRTGLRERRKILSKVCCR